MNLKLQRIVIVDGESSRNGKWRASGRSLTGTVKLNHLDLFSGIGGFSLGLERTGGFRTIGFCETDAYCTKVLQKNFPGIPIHGDIRKLKGTDFGAVDIITAGFPCQPFSQAGKRNIKDDRNLWKETFRVIKESKVPIFIGENVNGIVKLYLDTVLQDLEGEGYSVRCFNIPASSVGLKHQRQRIFIIAYSNEGHAQAGRERQGGVRKESEGQRISSDASSFHETFSETKNWGETFSDILRGVDGISSELDENHNKRLMSLGNSLVPQIPYLIGLSIISSYEDNDTV